MRAAMAEDWVASHLQPGLSKHEIADLLGLDASHIGRTRSENIGGWGWCCYLELEFDDSDLLVKAYLNPY